jgi:uncharacterized protein (UPF0216 family)
VTWIICACQRRNLQNSGAPSHHCRPAPAGSAYRRITTGLIIVSQDMGEGMAWTDSQTHRKGNPLPLTTDKRITGQGVIRMTHSPRIADESVLTRWMSMEIGKMNEGIVQDRKSLSVLLCEKPPNATTKKGEMYYFEKGIIAALGAKLPCELHTRLKLPILFFVSPDVPDSCSCTDSAAFEALKILGEISELRTMQDGRCWVSRAIVYAIMHKYPTAVQLVMRP